VALAAEAAVALVSRLGFACARDRPPQPTWSFIPWHLRAALSERIPVVDLPVQGGRVLSSALWHAHHRTRSAFGVVHPVNRVNDALVQARLRRRVSRSASSAVLQIGDLARLNVPYFVYQDMNRLLLADWARRIGPQHLGYADVAAEITPWRTSVEQRRLAGAAGVFTMSSWQAEPLLTAGVVSATQVHVVGAGISSRRQARTSGPAAGRLLFVGGDFPRKGGDIAVEALRILRKDFGRDVSLTVIGPPVWPLAGPVPDGVHFRGRQTPEQVGQALDEHDVFVMPTRFEAFGIAFVEALAAGLPCVGPRAFAIPEIVNDGVTGVLVDDWSAPSYADAIATVLQTPAVREQATAAADSISSTFSWDAVAARMLAVIEEAA
jgi:glycosyltransferase involved in cell wall biosynthesis